MTSPRVLLYRPPARHHITVFPQKTLPLGLLSIASTLRAELGAEVMMVDGFEGLDALDLVAAVRSFQPQVLGISGLTAHAYDGMAAATLVRQIAPDLLICAGGIHFSAVPEETLRICEDIDVIAISEGEITFTELCAVIAEQGRGQDWRRSLAGVAGLAWLEGSGPGLGDDLQATQERVLHRTAPRPPMPDLAALRRPAFDLSRPERYRMRPFRWNDFMPLESSRGCPFRCTYCHTTQFWQTQWRPRPIEAVLEEIEYAVEKMGRRAIHFTDDSWATRRERVIALCEGILHRGLKVELWAQCRVDDLYRDRDLFPLMRRAGFYGFLIGFESGEQDNLDRWKKGVASSKAMTLGPLLAETFDSIIGTFFIGDWQTTAETFARTRAFADAVGVDVFIEAPLGLFPPTIPIWKEYQSRGLDMEWDYDQIGNCKVIFPTETLSKSEVSSLQGRNMMSFYGSPSKALHALQSGPHATRQFSSMLFAGVEDLMRVVARSVVPTHLRGEARVLREYYRARHLAHAAVRPMPQYRSIRG